MCWWSLQKAQQDRSGTAAFSLLELLLVVTILALLLSILLPGVAGARRTARAARCGANLHSVGGVAAAYQAENRDTLPAAAPYLDFVGPASRVRGWDTRLAMWATRGGSFGGTWRCGEQKTVYRGNSRLLGLDFGAATPGGKVFEANDTGLKTPARVLLAHDVQNNLLDSYERHTLLPEISDVSDEYSPWPRDGTESPIWLPDSGPHRGKYGILFFDGHVGVQFVLNESQGTLWSGRAWWRGEMLSLLAERRGRHTPGSTDISAEGA